MIPSSHEQVAKQIAQSWVTSTHNFVLVAPPLTLPDFVFRLLADEIFLSSLGIPTQELAIARVSDFQFRNSEQFVKRICLSWQIPESNRSNFDHLDVLEEATETIRRSGKRPIILLPRFHKALEKLSWNLGARLRELEHHLDLSTVVEIPIPLSRLRDRWDNMSSKEDFICSDFGQGHHTIAIGPMTESEIEVELSNRGVEKILAPHILKMTGGLPGLVKWLAVEATSIKSCQELTAIGSKNGAEQLERFVQWLDAPNSNYYAERIAQVHLGIASRDDIATIRQHDWNELIISRNGKLKIDLLGATCTQHSQYGQVSKLRVVLADMVRSRHYEEASSLLSHLPEPHNTDRQFNFYKELIDILHSYKGISPDWNTLKKSTSSAIRSFSQQSMEIKPTTLSGCLNDLKSFADTITHWRNKIKSNAKADWRLGDCLCGRAEDDTSNSSKAALQFVAHKLNQAKALEETDHGAAFKAIFELPEQLFNMYVALKLGVSVWSSPEIEGAFIDEINRVWKGSEYIPPKQGERLGFNHVIYIGWAMSRSLSQSEQLLQNEEELVEWANTYSSIRGPTAHSTTEISKSDWIRYWTRCDLLFSRLSQALKFGDRNQLLPSIRAEIEKYVRGELAE